MYEPAAKLTYPEVQPPALQMVHLEAESDGVDFNHLTPAETVAVEYGRWLLELMDPASEEDDGSGTVGFERITRSDLFSPQEIWVTDNRGPDAETSAYVALRMTLAMAGGEHFVGLTLATETMPPLDEDREDTEVVTSYKLYYKTGSKTIAELKHAQTADPETLMLFRNTLDVLQQTINDDFVRMYCQ